MPPPSWKWRLTEQMLPYLDKVFDWVCRRGQSSAHHPEVAAILRRTRPRTDISDHLLTLFTEGLAARPRLIVELGVRGGESTYVLERVARLSGGVPLVSVDLEDCTGACRYPNWFFVKSDDVALAQTFPEWCRERQLPAAVDLLFIDTSHLYDHTLQEIKHWFPLLSPSAKVVFHDTNLRRIYWRKDGSFGPAWTNRGVTAAIEACLGVSLPERTDYVDLIGEWMIRHNALSNGLTVLTRIPTLNADAEAGAN